jgi:FAD/FMN-containing dehydrogenase
MNTELPGPSASVLDALRRHVRGTTIVPGDGRYAIARRVWNAAIDQSPAAIVVCADAEDATFALRVAAENHLQVTVRGGGHNVAGRAVRDGALLLDLSRLRDVVVNPKVLIATVQGGAVWRDVDAATATEALATTGGLVSSTGVGGFTLGGGAGWLMRKHGLASDNLLSAGVVLGDGRFVRASPGEHPDLFWGLRGGAGGLGVVTSLEYRLHPLRSVLAGLVIHPSDQAHSALRAFRDFAAVAPDEFCGLAVIAHAPPLPFLDAGWHGRPVVIYAVCWSGDLAAGERALEPLRNSGHPLVEHVGPMPYAQWQQMQDPAAPAGRWHYWKTANYATLSDATIDQLAAAAHNLPSVLTEIHIQHMGGAVARVPAGESAFSHRDAQFFVNLIGAVPTADQFGGLRERVRELYDRITPEAMPSILPNFSGVDDGDPVRRFGMEQAGRLEALRRRYDPTGLLAGA